ncbi:MAG: efflux RND transporter periplasmic adaptor subunit, partial [Actinobacteria bacterium]|nr:efflux RND transporter periplasmic adaptor subunit [Actinomycetota bacterium]
VFHDMGDRVKPGEPLIEMETEDADLAVRQAERRLQVELAKLGLKELPSGEFDAGNVPPVLQAKATLEKAKRLFERERSLRQRNAGTTQDFQNAESDERSAEAALANAILVAQSTLANAQSARVALEIAQHDRREMEVRAPVPTKAPEGVTEAVAYAVAKRSVSEGQMLQVGDDVMDLVIEKPLRLWASVPERYSADVKLGQPVRVTVSTYPGTPFEGQVVRINPAVDTASRTFQVEALVPNNRGLLRPGGFAKASILTERHAEATVVPVEAVVEYAGVVKVFVVEDGKARAVNVEKGQEGPGWVEVLGAIPDKARVVITGQTQLAEGTPVTVRAEPGAQGDASPAVATAPVEK